MKMIKDILFELLPLAGPSGNEGAVQNKMESLMIPMVDGVSADNIGNRIFLKKGRGDNKVMIIAHADEVAFVVTYIDENGFVYFQEDGAIDTNVLPEQIVEIYHGDEINSGVIGKKPLHLQNKAEYSKDWDTEELWIDLGVSSKEEAEKLVEVGDYITFKTQPMMLQNDIVLSKSLDDKAGLAALASIAESLKGKEIKDNLYFVSSVQEELGARGAKVAAESIRPDIAIAIDTTHTTDYPSISPQRNGDIRVNGGAVITKGPNIDQEVSNELIEIAKTNNIKYQIQAISHPAGSDINPIQLAGLGVRTALVSIPLRYMHQPNEIASIEDIKSVVKLISLYCQQNH